jgi:DNA gyrase subunit A
MTPREEDAVRHLYVASTHDYILVFTSAGRVHWLKVHALPEVSPEGKGKPVVNLIQIGAGERVADLISLRDFTASGHVVLATRRGYVKKTALEAFSRPRAAGIIALGVDEGDEVLAAALSRGSDEVFMATAKGKAIRFRETDVRPMGRTARGVIGIRMAADDRLVEMEVLAGKRDILTVTQNGYGKRTPVDDYRLQGRGGSGIINIKTSARNGDVVAGMGVGDDDEMLIITANGKIIRFAVRDVSRLSRATQGVRLIHVDEGDRVAAAIRRTEEAPGDPAEADESEGAG